MEHEKSVIRTTEQDAVEYALARWDGLRKIGEHFVKTGFLPTVFKTPEQVAMVIMYAKEHGIKPMQALNGGLFPVGGRVGMSTNMMLGIVQASGLLEDIMIKYDEESRVCTVTIKRKGYSPHTTTFGEKDALLAGLTGTNYQKYRKYMYQWRAISANLRVTFADFLANVHSPEELGAEVVPSEEGEMTVIEPAVEVALDIMSGGSVDYNQIYQALLSAKKSKNPVVDKQAWYQMWYKEIKSLDEKKQRILRQEYGEEFPPIMEAEDGTRGLVGSETQTAV